MNEDKQFEDVKNELDLFIQEGINSDPIIGVQSEKPFREKEKEEASSPLSIKSNYSGFLD